ncbi:hypothetical protein [Frigidibacter sp. ROC022]|uniref:hypothetical protein n=1 Tax=Frigidibacter sp. ROC022 TaxID=2971796 RepID=UPI00215AD922|nr:hypothetical protein [Frigidibacter sp. ROC022]MCR8726437.1 hypothetical protein [Frigidibacter sp. ROC022]
MASLAGHHSPHGAGDFLGLRRARSGGFEIVYDDGAMHRQVWRVARGTAEGQLDEALQAAMSANRVVSALYTELKKRGVSIDVVAAS